MTTRSGQLTDLPGRDYFLPYQWDWIRDESQKKIYPKSRRCGVTYGTSYRCVTKCLRQSQGTDFVQWVSSRDLGLAREFITTYVRRWCKLANVIATGLEAEDTMVIDPEKDIRAFVVTFPNGARIISLSSNPNAFAGKGGDILLDEADLHDDSGVLIDMALPCIDWGGQIEIVSAYAADGSTETPFAILVDEIKQGGNPAGWKLHETTIEDAVKGGIVEKINEARAKRKPKPLPSVSREQFLVEQRAKCRTEAAWLSQYMCLPCNAAGQKAVSLTDLNDAKEDYGIIRIHIDGDAGPGDKIDPAVTELLDRNIWRELAEYIGSTSGFRVGYDVARVSDLSSFWIDHLEGREATARLVASITMRGCKFASQEEFLHQGYRTVALLGAGDATGMGMQICERLADEWNDPSNPELARFLGVNFSADKGVLGSLLTETFEKGRQIIPSQYREIPADILCIEKALTIGKRLTYTEKQNRLLPESHADIAWSCALAKLAIERLKGEGKVFGGLPGEMGATRYQRYEKQFGARPDHGSDYRHEMKSGRAAGW
ncbi:MAG: hypothetical protein HON70_06305 [Lentisphaerae bacterium]|jgi:phage FluMu gp28-like protein|nr:hypothetical protein [Lentisphaerota bacterium]